MIGARTALCLGLSQLICWGITFYLIGAFGELIAADLGWSRERVYGGFSAALIAMGLASPWVGRLIDRHGGRAVMSAGSLVTALGCAGMALAGDVLSYYAAWLAIGLAMRLTLYDAAFAALARIGGPGAKRAIAQVTLLGGLASTVFWPIGHGLAELFGWRGALLAYAGFALLTLPLHLAIPRARFGDRPDSDAQNAAAPLAGGRRERVIAGALYATIVTLTSFLNAGMSAHMIAVLMGLGLAATAAVKTSSLRGIGQSSARLCEVLFGRRLHPLDLNLGATSVLPLCFVIGLFSGQAPAAALGFAFLYGAGNGLVTITRGTLPLVLFDHETYGARVGALLMPSFTIAAAAPLIFATVIDSFGPRGGLVLAAACGGVVLAASIALKLRFSRRS